MTLVIPTNKTHDSFRDMLETKPILPKTTPDARCNSDSNDGTDEDDHGSADDISTTPLFSGHGWEEGAGPYYSSDSGGSSTGKGGRLGREVRRPESVILRGDSYVGLTDFRKHRDLWAANTYNICRTCHDGSRNWCPTSHECQRHKRASRKRHLSRCSSCGKVWVLSAKSQQWCCQNWISGPSGDPSPTR